uniref:Odorant-binding protein 4 n=1 Tax=Adelphocoris suturalis TaxID=323751 RepID=A0A166IG76_9HEMI|nr:odorant-binding protein 4 [Adelphocoris suturalis]
MRIFVIFTAALTCVMAGELPEEMKEMAQGLHDSCVEETGVDNGLIAPCAKGNFADDAKLRCYFKCVFGNLGVISDEGELDAEAFGSILPDSMQELLPTIKSCGGTTGSDPCDLAMNFNKCLQKADPVNFMVI